MKKLEIIGISFLILMATAILPVAYGSSDLENIVKTSGVGSSESCADDSVEYWAVIISLAEYEDYHGLPMTIMHQRSLNDALLRSRARNWDKDHITLLLNEDATIHNIRSALTWLASNSDSNDIVLFAYQGHGYAVTDDDGDEADGMDEIISTYSYRRDDNGVPVDGTYLTDDDLDSYFDAISCEGMFLIFESCLSGGLVEGEFSNTMFCSVEKSIPCHTFSEEFAADVDDDNRVVLMSSQDQGLSILLFFPPVSLTRLVSFGFKGGFGADYGNSDIGYGVSAEYIANMAANIFPVFLMLLFVNPFSLGMFIMQTLAYKITEGYWIKPIPTVCDRYPGDLPIVLFTS